VDNDAAAAVGILIGVLLIGGFFGGICAAIASSKGRSVIGWFFGGFFLGFIIFPFFGIIMIILVACLPNLKEKQRREEAIDRENRRLREQLMQEQIKNEAFRRHAAARLDNHDVQLGVDTRSAAPLLGAGFPGAPQLGSTTPMLEHDPLANLMPEAPGATPTFGDPAASNPFRDPFAGGSASHVQTNHGQTNDAPPFFNGVPSPRSNGAYPPERDAGSSPPPLPAGMPQNSPTPAREWHYEIGGETRGPVTDRQLIALAKSGEVTAATLLWTEQLGDWKAAGQIKPLQPHLRT